MATLHKHSRVLESPLLWNNRATGKLWLFRSVQNVSHCPTGGLVVLILTYDGQFLSPSS